ncbi:MULTISPECIES: type II secretion system F family protein [unclassified Mycobacterium]|uniref:type II secretion system F family protein n=1 Tax=unclassified Mycobacterium TaxID=2642494 RepID=UPI000568E068|nr:MULTISPECIES: type II secretion system F family protein [unclassified Mycobacterium]
MSAAAILLAVAVLAAAGPATARGRARPPRPERPSPRQPVPGSDALALAADLEVFALCLTAGMSVSGAATATARHASPALAAALHRGADLLALGAEPGVAWSAPNGQAAGALDPTTTAVLRMARRSGSSGTALAGGLGELATQCRDEAAHSATAAAERAGVLIAGPLGLCFLPAFVCLGIVPVVAGLAGDVLRSGLL